MHVLTRLLSFLCLLAATGCWPVLAGSSTVMGRTDAFRCYMESRHSWSFDGEKPCEQAIRQGDLTRRDLAATLSNRGIIRARNGDYEGAIEDHTAALELMSDLVAARVNRGNVYYRLRDYDRALRDFEAAGRSEKGPAAISRVNAGMTLMRLAEPLRAVETLEEALRLDPESALAKEMLSLAREMAGEAAGQGPE